jgi:sn-glycerol 3-phosphate transport system ATP-binding protein
MEPCAPGDAMLSPEIELVEPLGADTLVYGRVDGGARIAARLHSASDARVGARLPLRYDPARAHYFDAESGKRLD